MDIIIKNIVLVDALGGEPLENAVIGIERGLLGYVGAASGAPKNADLVIDGNGMTALPGLINAHVHMMLDAYAMALPRVYNADGENLGVLQAAARGNRALRAGITTVRDCNAPGTGSFALRTAFAEKLLPGPRLICSGCAICATGGHMHAISYEADGPEEVMKGVRTQIKAGADFIKMVADGSTTSGSSGEPPQQLTAAEMKAGVDVAHRLGKRVTAHAVSRNGVREALDAGVDGIEHGYDLPDDLIMTMRERGTWLVPTLSVHGAILRNGPEAGWSRERLANSERVLGMAMETLGRAFRAGVNVACGSDAGSPFNHHWEIVPEMQLMCQAGLTASDAIIAATRKAADALGEGDRLGTLEADKIADVILVDGSAFSDLAALERVRWVIKDGTVVVAPGR